jgi:hypothetical protein
MTILKMRNYEIDMAKVQRYGKANYFMALSSFQNS